MVAFRDFFTRPREKVTGTFSRKRPFGCFAQKVPEEKVTGTFYRQRPFGCFAQKVPVTFSRGLLS